MSDLVAALAEGFLSRYGDDCRIHLFDIAASLGLAVEEVESESFDGALLRIRGQKAGLIAIRRGIREPSRKLFTLAHEIGHYLLPNQQDLVAPCGPSDVERWGGVARLEQEANRFAAEILMPRRLVAGAIRQEPSLDVVRTMAATYGTSLTASAYRLVELSTFRVALVVSVLGIIQWYRASAEFDRFVRAGPLDPRTVAYDCAAGRVPPLAAERLPADAWLRGGNLRQGSEVWEQAVSLPTYDTVLSLLYLRERVEQWTDDDEEEDPELEPSEFGIGRKRWPGRKR